MVHIDYDGIHRAFSDVKDYEVFTMEPPWSRCADLFPHPPDRVTLVEDVDFETVERYANQQSPDVSYTLGLGGGRAVDVAKYVALKRKTKLITVPTIIAADAYITPKAAIRKENLVVYIGDIFPHMVVVDYDVIKSAPSRLNIAGVGDIYSSKISLLDWKLARDQEGEKYDPDTAEKAEKVLKKLSSSKDDIRNLTESGIKSMIEMHVILNELQWPYLQSRYRMWPQEGSEHLFFYSLEKSTGKSFVHGEVVAAGCIVAAYMHGENVEQIRKELKEFGLSFGPQVLDISFNDFEAAILNLSRVGKEANLHYAIVDQFRPTGEALEEIWHILLTC
jgi:glycerol-1-phosphate dehydrogenase [NAD(P)+]